MMHPFRAKKELEKVWREQGCLNPSNLNVFFPNASECVMSDNYWTKHFKLDKFRGLRSIGVFWVAKGKRYQYWKRKPIKWPK